MSSHLDQIPTELIYEISIYLKYKDILNIRKGLFIKLEYEKLLARKYPGFYKVVKFLKNNILKYEDYSYQTAYNLADMMETSIQYIIEYENEVNIESSTKEVVYNFLPPLNFFMPVNFQYNFGYDVNTVNTGNKYFDIYSDNIEDIINVVYENNLLDTKFGNLVRDYGYYNDKSINPELNRLLEEYPIIEDIDADIFSILSFEFIVLDNIGTARTYVNRYRDTFNLDLGEVNISVLIILYAIVIKYPELSKDIKDLLDCLSGKLKTTTPEKWHDESEWNNIRHNQIIYYHIIDHINMLLKK